MFTYSPLGKALEKQTKTIENQDKKQIKAIEDHRKQLVESNELIKKDFNINRDIVPYKFHNLEKKINPDDLIYKYKTEGRSPKDFRNYPNPIDFLKNLRDGNVNPKEVKKSN